MPHLLAAALLLQLHNLAGAPPAIVAAAASETARLYADFGVRLEWRAAPVGGEVIRVILLPYETGDLRRAADTVMGAAIVSDHRTPIAYVYYRRVSAEADRYAASTIQVLACAIAHEIGHLLMPGVQHSADGLMRARWGRDDVSRADQGRLRFSAAQVALIRARAAGEVRTQSSAPAR